MTDQEQPKDKKPQKPESEMTKEELRQKRLQERIEELRKRDPFIYR